MDARRIGDTILVRLDRGEELTEQLRLLARREGLHLASVTGLGALSAFTAGVYDTAAKRFCPREYQGLYEIVSLRGTVDTMDGAYYAHLHLSAAGEDGLVRGGHLTRAVVSATAELVVTVLHGQIDRTYDPDTGLNLWDFPREPA
jgi:predicted DNA-binding protein with PD1-like motif